MKDLVLNGAKVHINVSASVGGLSKSVDETLTIPDLHLQNIGNGDGGATPAQLAMQILQPVLNEAIVVATDELKKQGAQQLQNELNKQLQKQNNPELNKATQGVLTNLFK